MRSFVVILVLVAALPAQAQEKKRKPWVGRKLPPRC